MTKDTNQENALRVIRYLQSNTGGKELNHLLLAINKSNKTPHKQAMTLDGKCMINYKYETTGMAIQGVSASPYSYPKQTGWSSLDYDLTKTVRQNLTSNKELAKMISELIC